MAFSHKIWNDMAVLLVMGAVTQPFDHENDPDTLPDRAHERDPAQLRFRASYST